ncbi:hypothetical protein IWW36_000837 [Coemansia brasiliensis]|uniref:SH3 domain-containing protein n=1 Tax=Coemansia brasiliensis TaxID=2650707 RepID=A0A9W8M226_9FUNG|nr:hypothetical protein IWW36_000837 [Coemansia brasiliensis]
MVCSRPRAGAWKRIDFIAASVASNSRMPSAYARSAHGSHTRTATWSCTWLRYVAVLALVLLATPSLAADPTDGALSASLSGTNVDPTPGPESNLELGELLGRIAENNEENSSDEDVSDSDDNEGSIGIVGAFNGVSSFSPGSSGAALGLDSSSMSLLSLTENSATLLAAASASGQVTAACTIYESGSFKKVFMGGSISMMNTTTVGYVFGVDASGNVDSMLGGVNGPVNALYCDNDTQLVYVGGNFTSTVNGLTSNVATMRSTSTGSLAIYDADGGAWRPLSFRGLDGPVFDFAKVSKHVYAVGEFTSTVDNATHTALNEQPMDLSACTITGGNNAEIQGFSDPHNIICTQDRDSAGNTWLMRDKLPGYYRIDFPFKATPSLLRLMNTLYEGRGTKAIRVEAAPNNQALTMSYLDPETRVEMFCTQSCPLPQDNNWHEFRFVDNADILANITGIIVNIVDWYGMGGGFNKIELYQRDASVHAIDSYNASPCSSQAIRPSSQITGNWKPTTAASYHGSYLTFSVNRNEISSAEAQSATVTLVPFVPESGFYRVYMSIPGCQNTNTCAQRTSAKVIWLMNNKRSVVTTVAQHNLEDEEVPVLSGYVPASSMNFSSAIYVQLANEGDVNPQAASVEVVVDSFRLERITSYTDLNGVIELFEDLNSDLQVDGPLYAPLKEGLPASSAVYAATHGTFNDTNPEDTLFLGGQFFDADKNYYSIACYRDEKITTLANAGVWGDVRALTFIGSSLYAGGSFNGTADFSLVLNNVGEYNTTDQQWYPLVGGTNGVVNNVMPYAPFGSRAVAFTGDFTVVNGSDGTSPVEIGVNNGLAMWDALAGGWTNTPYLEGKPSLVYSDAWNDKRDSVAFAAGNFNASAALKANGAVLLTPSENIQAINMMGFDLQPSDSGNFVVNSGLWYAKNNGTTPMLVVGGQFRTLDGGINVAKLDNGKWKRLITNINGEVLTINNAANLLFVGGVANVTADTSEKEAFTGLKVLDMDRDRVFETPSLKSPDGDSSGVRVNKIAIRADTSMVVVGGNFTLVGGMLSCPYICTLDINDVQWSPLATSTLIDQVTDLLFVRDRLIVAGTFKNGTEPTKYLREFDFGSNAWADIDGADKIPGPVTVLTAASDGHETTDGFYITGVSMKDASPYFYKYDGSTVIAPKFTIDSKSTINGILEVPRSRIPDSVLGTDSSSSPSPLARRDSAPVIPENYVLAISGDLYLPNGQRASNAFFYNNEWAPFLSTVQDNGSPGYISSVFFEIPPTNVYQRHRLSVALVIIIAIAIALGITFLIVLVGLVYIYLRNRREAAATASAASAALAATTAGAGTTKVPLGAATIMGTGAAAGARHMQGDGFRGTAGARETWGNANAVTGEPVSFDNIAPSTGRLNSGPPVGLAGLAAAGRKAAVSSDTYVQQDIDKKANYDDANESLDSIFKSAAAEAEAEAESEARERATSTGSMNSDIAVAGAYAMPTPRHYTSQQHDARDQSESPDHSRTSMYRADSTNPFEQRMALRESQGAFPPAGPFADGDDGVGHIPMPSPRHIHSEHATAAALAAASGGAATGLGAMAAAKDARRRSESASTRNTDAEYSASQSPSSRPSGESSVGGSSAHLPIRDSLKQYPVFYAKFTFSSRETGELGFRAGERVFVIDQSDEIWWMGIVDHGSDQPLEQGVFPATYVSSEPPKSNDWTELM